MTREADIEIYKERYETFRHLDKLRWQMLQLAIASSAAILSFGSNGAVIHPWALSITGFVLISLGIVMEKISFGVWKNNKVLSEVGARIGDSEMPPQAKWYASASFMIALVMIFIGFATLGASVI